MKTLAVALLNLLLLLAAVAVRADLTIEITQGADNPTAIAVVPLAWQGQGVAPEDVALVIESDMLRSGQFAPVARADMLGFPSSQDEVFYKDWRALETEYLLIGKASPAPNNGLRVDYELFDVLRQARVFSGMEAGPASDARMLGHRVADKIYEHLTGVRGAFATRILYVSVIRGAPGGKSTYRLTMSDSDGARPVVLLESREPLLAPAWAPDAKQIAYVSFETGRPAIFRQDLATGAREQLTNFQGPQQRPGLVPGWQNHGDGAVERRQPGHLPDGPGDQAVDQYHQQLSPSRPSPPGCRMANHCCLPLTAGAGRRSIAMSWVPGLVKRVTFEGTYNARARVAQDGRNVVMVHQKDGNFNIALLDLVTNRLQVLTSTALDESPSIAPNGSMVLYATKFGDRGILAAVSVDGGAKFRLPGQEGDVREPAWSPFLTPE